VLVPVGDVITANSHSYVMAAVDRTDAEKAEIRQLITDKDYTGLQKYMGTDAGALNIRMLTDPAQLLYGEVRAVETGIQNAYFIEIRSGLSEGEKVIAQSTDSESSQRNYMTGGFGGLTGEFPAGGNFPGRQERQNSGGAQGGN